MRTQIEEIKLIVDLINIYTLKGFRDLEGTNTGSNHKEKDVLVNSVCATARKYRRLTTTLHQCLEWLIEGYTIQDFYNKRLENATRNNQCKQDMDDSIEELAMFTDLIIEL